MLAFDRLTPCGAGTDLLDGWALLDLLPGPVAYIDHDLRYRYVNTAYAAWSGAAAEDIVGRHCREIIGETDYPPVAARLHAALGGAAVSCEHAFVRAGQQRRVLASCVPHRDRDGAVLGVVALLNDLGEHHELRARIAASEQMLDQAFDNAPTGMAVVDANGRIIRCNARLAALLDYPIGDMVGMDFRAFCHPDDMAAEAALFAAVLTGTGTGSRRDRRYLRRDGHVLFARLSTSVVRDAAGRLFRVVCRVDDIDRERAEGQRARRATARLELAVDAVRGGFWHLDVASMTFEVSPQLAGFVSGDDAATIDLAGYIAAIHPADRDGGDLAALIEGRADRASAEYRLVTPAGVRAVRCDRRLLRDGDGRPEQVVGMVIDVSEERERQRLLQQQAETDGLTGLLNRRGMMRRLEAADRGVSYGVLVIDLDHFKSVNDRHGHALGDALLVEVAGRLRAALREADLICRHGGDEFVVMMPAITREATAAVAERLAVALAGDYRADGTTVEMSGSIGAAWASGLGQGVADLVAQADAALYAAKDGGRGGWRLAV